MSTHTHTNRVDVARDERHRTLLRAIHDHHLERHVAATKVVEDFFGNLMVLFGFPADGAPQRHWPIVEDARSTSSSNAAS